MLHNPRSTTSMDSADPDERIGAALNTLHSLYGSDVPTPAAAHSTDWLHDRFSHGSYSYPRLKGNHPRHVGDGRPPRPRADRCGRTHGPALLRHGARRHESGRRAAALIGPAGSG
ncbi:MAG: FAD-dependent oxidoreductase [Acidimicrobiales bacterium]